MRSGGAARPRFEAGATSSILRFGGIFCNEKFCLHYLFIFRAGPEGPELEG